jgi:hypothetical protein
LTRLFALDDALAPHGFPRLSPWWRATLTEFYESRRRQLVLRCGRRGGKSSSLVRVAVCEAIYGEHVITPGDVGIVGIVSVSRDEAAQRLRLAKAILDVLGVRHKPIEGGIELEHRPIAFKVYAATVAGVVGGTWVSGICDEVARWKDADTGANPATLVLASLRPTMATQPNAKLFLSSSPLGTEDAHADAFKVGDTAWQQVALAPTWIANPTISEDDTHALERDDEVWRREYAAQPIAGSVLSIFSETMLAKATRAAPAALEPEPGRSYVAAMDPATRGNAWTLAIATEGTAAAGGSVTRIVRAREWRGTKSAPLDPDTTLAEIAAVLLTYGLTEVWSDQFASDFVVSIAQRHGLTVQIEPSTAASKVATYEGLRARLADGAIELCPSDQLRADLLGVNKLVTRNGISIELTKTPDGRHCDFASAASLAITKCAGDATEPPFVLAMRAGRAAGFFHGFGGPPPPKPAPKAIPDYPTEDVPKTSAWEHKKDGGSEWARLANRLAGGSEPREKTDSSVHLEVGLNLGRAEGAGSWRGMTATWQNRSAESVFSPNASESFKAGVSKERARRGV